MRPPAVARAAFVRRDTGISELMDDPDCDRTALDATYRDFGPLNRLLSGWRRIYTGMLRPVLAASAAPTVLDLGSGGGDVARSIVRWAARDGIAARVTGIDPDERAHAFASSRPAEPGLSFRRATSAELVAEGARFDVVLSNHVLHHLDEHSLADVLRDSAELAGRLVVHNDIARSWAAYRAYGVVTRPFARRSFIHVDGSLSIRRSWTAAELRETLPAGWAVRTLAPSRLLAVLDRSGS